MQEGFRDWLRGGGSDSKFDKNIDKYSDAQLRSIANKASLKSARRVLSPSEYKKWVAARKKLGLET